MKLGIISDTHDHFDKAEEAADFFEGRVDAVIHCGDMICPATAELFDRDFDFYAVRGNNDGEWDLKSKVESFGKFYNNTAELEFDGLEIAVYHGTEEEIVDALVESGEYDYVFRGHTHERKLERREDTIELNPGGVELPFQDEEFSFAILETETRSVKFYQRGDLHE